MFLKKCIKSFVLMFKKKKTIPVEKIVYESKQFEGRVAIILGGTGGIGLSIAKNLNRCGCKVIICSTNSNKIDICKNDFKESDSVKYFIFNVLEINKIKENILMAEKIFGKIDTLICCNGVHSEVVAPLEFSESEYDRIMDINLKGTYFAANEFSKYLISNNIQGNILFVSSSRGFEPAFSPYGLSKWAINGLTRGLALNLAKYGIVVNSIAPGTTATSLIGYKDGETIHTFDNKFERMILPEEVSNIVLTLLGNSGRMLTGETIIISGGRGIFDIR